MDINIEYGVAISQKWWINAAKVIYFNVYDDLLSGIPSKICNRNSRTAKNEWKTYKINCNFRAFALLSTTQRRSIYCAAESRRGKVDTQVIVIVMSSHFKHLCTIYVLALA